jgi:hypothetical protein
MFEESECGNDIDSGWFESAQFIRHVSNPDFAGFGEIGSFGETSDFGRVFDADGAGRFQTEVKQFCRETVGGTIIEVKFGVL